MNFRMCLKKLGDLSLGLLSQTAIFFIAIYKVVFSPWMGGACRFYPSCSEYAHESFKSHNFTVATSLSVQRLFKCRPGGDFGFDPVPRPQQKQRTSV